VGTEDTHDMAPCEHTDVECLNHYELIRKYRCRSCGAVCMCACEEDLAKTAWPHQTREGSEYNTRKRVPVTAGFQPRICNACRGLPEEPHPKAPLYGRTSKIYRYYWREIQHETTRRFHAFAISMGYANVRDARAKEAAAYDRIETEVVEEIKRLHEHSPKYTYSEESDDSVLATNRVHVVRLRAEYVKTPGGKAQLKAPGGDEVSVETWVSAHFEGAGWAVLQTESVPLHALFGTLMWVLIQDPTDPKVRMVGFGRRSPSPAGTDGPAIWTGLPEDFGAPGYATRRIAAIEAHLSFLPDDKDGIRQTFDHWIDQSVDFREYLWAHRPEDVSRARTLLDVLPVEKTKCILKYLVEDYWRHFCGWPDLFAYSGPS
jgi:hypothetical protein